MAGHRRKVSFTTPPHRDFVFSASASGALWSTSHPPALRRDILPQWERVWPRRVAVQWRSTSEGGNSSSVLEARPCGRLPRALQADVPVSDFSILTLRN